MMMMVYYLRKRKNPRKIKIKRRKRRHQRYKMIQNIPKVLKECGGKELPMKILNKIKLMILMFNSMVLTVSIHKDPQPIQKIDLL